MKSPHLLFILLLLMSITVAGLWFVEDVPNGQGFDHADYPENTIQQAPNGLYRHRQVLPVAVGYGVLVCLFTVVGMAIGLNEHTKEGVGAKVFWIAAVVYALLFLAVPAFYWTGLKTAPSYLFGFPRDTGWMLFVLWPSPLLLIVIYMLKFDQWILRPDDEARFHDLVASRRTKRMD